MALRLGLLALTSAASIGAAAQVAPLRYQLCEAEPPAVNVIQRMETNYRYPAAATTRSFRAFAAYRCEPAWVQSPAIFDAAGVCPYEVTGCSADANGTCGDGPDDWVDYDFLGARLWSDTFTQESAWPQNAQVRVHSGVRGVEQWTRHRWWGYDFPARYAYLGVAERPFTTAPGAHPRCYGMAYLVGLFNGVWNTKKEAENGLDAVRAQDFVGRQRQGAPIRYRLFYNQTAAAAARWLASKTWPKSSPSAASSWTGCCSAAGSTSGSRSPPARTRRNP